MTATRAGYPVAYYTQSTAVGVTLHVHEGTVLDVRVPEGEDYASLSIGEHMGKLTLYIDGSDLDRLSDLLDDAALRLGRPMSDKAHEAYAAGWDAAVAWVQNSTEQPVPAPAPAATAGAL